MTTLEKEKGQANEDLTYFDLYGKRRMKCSIVIALRKWPPTFIVTCKHKGPSQVEILIYMFFDIFIQFSCRKLRS